ncbi:MAG: YlxR family protein [Nocardioidaceae bacterium]
MSRPSPVRTCVGCRERAAKSDLLRVVGEVAGVTRSVIPDEPGTRAGRGAHLHPVPHCLDLAERRRAFPRALRVEGPLDTSAVRSYISQHPSGITREQ